MGRALAAFALICCVLLSHAVALAQNPGNAEIVIGTRESPPFAMKGQNGEWEGISIDLWRHLADQLHLHYRIEQRGSVQDLLDAVTSSKIDVAVGALTVTAERRKAMDFTQPFFSTGLGVAVPRGGLSAWLPLVRTFASFRFAEVVVVLLAIALLVGMLIWIFERRENEHYGGKPLQGFVAGAWWSAVAMTQAGAAQQGPRSTPGRAVAVVWMIASVLTIWVFIAAMTSVLTTQRLAGMVRNVDDLRGVRVGAVAGTSTVDYLTGQRIAFLPYASAADGLRAIQAGKIDAFVYDRPLLAYTIREQFPGMELTPIALDPQNYAFALPLGSKLRGPLDIALLDTLVSGWWADTRFRYLGQ